MIIKEYFNNDEVACPCCGALPLTSAIEKLYAVRLIYSKPIRVLSGARCPAHNKYVGGKDSSKHLDGIAFDIWVPQDDEVLIMDIARRCGFNGFGFWGNGSMHIDFRNEPALWVYK